MAALMVAPWEMIVASSRIVRRGGDRWLGTVQTGRWLCTLESARDDVRGELNGVDGEAVGCTSG
jgi:hypothetical protein